MEEQKKILRLCKVCNISKDIDLFNFNKTKKCQSIKGICKSCELIKNREYFKKYY